MTILTFSEDELENTEPEKLIRLADRIGVGYREFLKADGTDIVGLKEKVRRESL